MRLTVSTPPEWIVGPRHAVVPGAPGEPALSLRWSDLTLLPDDQTGWVRRTMCADVAAARLEVKRDDLIKTATGWPVRLVEATLSDAAGVVIEWRLGAFYAFLEHGATALVRCTSAGRFAAGAPALRTLLTGATPDWRDEIAALADFWDVRVVRPVAVIVPAAPVVVPSPVVAPPESQPVEAIAAWEAAAAADPTAIDPLYNAGLAHYQRQEFTAALDAWERALLRDPRDFAVHRKIVQAQHALGRHADAERSMVALRALWKVSNDPATRAVDEVVFDQFAVGDIVVHAFETLRPREPSSYALLTFRTAAEPTRPSIAVRIETSDYARERGVPYVLSVTKGREYKVIGTSAQLPPYAELKQTVAKLITQALA